jgi:hypothetical protein
VQGQHRKQVEGREAGFQQVQRGGMYTRRLLPTETYVRVSGLDTVMMESVAEFREVVEGNKSDLQQVNSEINTLKAPLSVGRSAASPSSDCSASKFQTDLNGLVSLNWTVQARLSFQSPLV